MDRLTPAELAELETLLEIEANEGIDALCAENVASESSGPLYWAQNWTATENPKYMAQGLSFKAPFPKKQYFVHVLNELFKWKRIFIPKTREMMTSWEVMVYATHQAQWHKAEVVVQTHQEKKAAELVEYAAILYRNQPEWLQKKHPLDGRPAYLHLNWSDGGKIHGIPSGEHQMRMFHPTIYVMDEVAFLPEAQQCYDTANPVANQIIGISSAGPGWFGDECAR